MTASPARGKPAELAAQSGEVALRDVVVTAMATLLIGLFVGVAVLLIAQPGKPPTAASDTRPLATAGAMPPAPRIIGVAGLLGSYCWEFRGAAIAQEPRLLPLPSPIPSDYQSGFCGDASADFGRFGPSVSAPFRLWLPNLQANVTASVQDQNGASSAATLNADGSVVLPPGLWRTLQLSIQWPGAAPNVEIGDAGYAWTLN
jgi:hypothetical protein